jgi:hypothetical protein
MTDAIAEMQLAGILTEDVVSSDEDYRSPQGLLRSLTPVIATNYHLDDCDIFELDFESTDEESHDIGATITLGRDVDPDKDRRGFRV